MTKYKKYEDIPKKYRFDLEYLLEGETFDIQFKKMIERIKNSIETKDSKFESAESFLKSLKYEDKTELMANKLLNYVSNNISTNVVNPDYIEIMQKVQFEIFMLQKELGSEVNRLIKHQKKVTSWMKDNKFANYIKKINTIFEDKKQKLSNVIEEFLIGISRAEVSAVDVFSILNNSELNYGYAVSSTGQKTKITRANRIKLLKSQDEKVRKSTHINWIKASVNHKQTFSNLLFQHFKNVSTWSLTRKHKSSVEALIHPDRADIKLLETVYSQVQKHNYLFKKHNDWSGKFYKAKFGKKKEKWDDLVPLVGVKDDYSVEEAQELVREAIKPLGEEYISKVNEAFEERWIDYYPVPNKRSGAYSIGQSYGFDKKFILMNFDGSLRSVGTLAHEMGHSIHSYYSDKKQPLSLSSYPIFLAEIASIFNELMLSDYLISNTDNDKLKFKLLDESISDFEGTVHRQAMWSNYEFDLYNLIDQGQPVSSFEAISEVYRKNALKYSISKTKFRKDEETIAGVIVPHFYYDFYVYKYSIGYIVANVFFQRYKKEGTKALEKYISKFLSAGARDWPIIILKDAGIDLYNENIYTQAFEILNEKVSEYIRLGKKIFKI